MLYKNQEDMPEQCPPSNTKANDVEPVFRYIENDTLSVIDFQNHIERELYYNADAKCEAIALSFFTTEESAKRLRSRFKKFRKKNIVKGRLTSKCGVHNIVNNHLNLWVFKDVDMLKVFTGEEDKEYGSK